MEVEGILCDLRSLSKDLKMRSRENAQGTARPGQRHSLGERCHLLQSAQALKPVVPLRAV